MNPQQVDNIWARLTAAREAIDGALAALELADGTAEPGQAGRAAGGPVDGDRLAAGSAGPGDADRDGPAAADEASGRERLSRPDPRAPSVDARTFEVVYGGRRVRLGNGLPLQLLARLLRRPGWYVSLEELANDVWKGRTIESATIQRCVSRLRTSLRDGGMHELADALDGGEHDHYALIPFWQQQNIREKSASCPGDVHGNMYSSCSLKPMAGRRRGPSPPALPPRAKGTRSE